MSEGFAREAVVGTDKPTVDTATAIGQAATKLNELADEMAKAKNEDTARYDALHQEQIKQAGVLDELKKKADAEKREADVSLAIEQGKAAMEFAEQFRTASKAGVIGSGNPGAVLAPSMSGYAKGSFVYNLYKAGVFGSRDGFLDDERRKAIEALRAMGHFEAPAGEAKGVIGDAPIKGLGENSQGTHSAAPTSGGGWVIPDLVVSAHAKATLGTTSATGGVLIPGAVVTDLVKPGRYRSAVTGLVNGIRGVSAYQTSIPVRVSAPARAVVALWGDTKENVNLTYGGYTATMYTLARIYDVAKQFLRFSQGAAEQDVLQELAHAFELGEAYYILQGDGTDEPYGIQTAIANAFGAYTTSFTPSATTLAGSIAKAVASAAGDLAVRNRFPEAALLAPAAYWTMVSQGTDTAGFFFAPAGGPENIRPGTLMSPFGLPVYSESQLAGTDDLLVGEFSAHKVFFGESYRVDTSDQAGTRWDANLVGFRGEEEMGADARAAVFAGAFQFIADVMP